MLPPPKYIIQYSSNMSRTFIRVSRKIAWNFNASFVLVYDVWPNKRSGHRCRAWNNDVYFIVRYSLLIVVHNQSASINCDTNSFVWFVHVILLRQKYLIASKEPRACQRKLLHLKNENKWMRKTFSQKKSTNRIDLDENVLNASVGILERSFVENYVECLCWTSVGMSWSNVAEKFHQIFLGKYKYIRSKKFDYINHIFQEPLKCSTNK